MMIKVSKEMLNELLRYISMDNQKYGLIFKITYIYGRNIAFPNKFKFWNIHALKGPPFYTETKEIFDYPIRVSGTILTCET